MPRPDPIPSPRLSMLRRFRRIMKWMALFSMAVAATAVLLVARGDDGAHIHMLIATALGAGLSVLLAGALMMGGRLGQELLHFATEGMKRWRGGELSPTVVAAMNSSVSSRS